MVKQTKKMRGDGVFVCVRGECEGGCEKIVCLRAEGGW